MDDQGLRSLLNQAREFELTIGAVTFRCRLPTMSQARRAYARYEGPSRLVEGMEDILADAVLSISGATARDLGLDGDDPLPESAQAAREYLAEHTEVADVLISEISRRARERQKKIEGDAKN